MGTYESYTKYLSQEFIDVINAARETLGSGVYPLPK